jgi:glycosyltransferase involved in cell wall biosynthesis
MNIAVDLTWLKPECEGGVESYVLNVLDGFVELKKDKNIYLFLALDNEKYIKDIYKKTNFNFIVCNTKAFHIKRHIIWQTLFFNKELKKNNINVVLFPIDETPWYKTKDIKYSTVIHDIQREHYPEYFSAFNRWYLRKIWKRVLKTSDIPLVTTNYTKQDIIDTYGLGDNLNVIPIPIVVESKTIKFDSLASKYNINNNEYYYTICSMRKHKNLITLVNVIKQIKQEKIKDIPNKLIISGVNGPDKENFMKVIKEENLEDSIILTGFVSNEERNTLIKKCNCFLFPSIFEGFGMPPVEAIKLGAKTITTKCASLPEVTMGKCEYVDDSLSIEDWINKIKEIQNKKVSSYDFPEFDKKTIAKQYYDLFINSSNK